LSTTSGWVTWPPRCCTGLGCSRTARRRAPVRRDSDSTTKRVGEEFLVVSFRFGFGFGFFLWILNSLSCPFVHISSPLYTLQLLDQLAALFDLTLDHEKQIHTLELMALMHQTALKDRPDSSHCFVVTQVRRRCDVLFVCLFLLLFVQFHSIPFHSVRFISFDASSRAG
jgi:hypothetical protein